MGRILVSGLAGSYLDILPIQKLFLACLAQLVERTAFNRMVLGSSPRVGMTKKSKLFKKKSMNSLSWDDLPALMKTGQNFSPMV